MPRGPGRSAAARQAILASTASLIARQGYGALSIEGIAADAGVGKQTIYRWWPSKSALVAECLADGALLPRELRTDDTGDVRADVTVWLERIAAFLARPGRTELMRSLVAAAVENEQVGEALNDRLGAAPTAVEGRLRIAAERGELAADSPVELLTEALLGAVILRVLYRAPFSADDARMLVEAVLGPALR